MNVIAGPVGSGKTKELMKLAYETNGTILTCNKRALMTKAYYYGYESVTIIDLNDVVYGNYDAAQPLYIHKINDVVKEYMARDFDLQLAGCTVTTED